MRRLPRRIERIADAAEHSRFSLSVRLFSDEFSDERDRRHVTGMLHQVLLTVPAATRISWPRCCSGPTPARASPPGSGCTGSSATTSCSSAPSRAAGTGGHPPKERVNDLPFLAIVGTGGEPG